MPPKNANNQQQKQHQAPPVNNNNNNTSPSRVAAIVIDGYNFIKNYGLSNADSFSALKETIKRFFHQQTNEAIIFPPESCHVFFPDCTQAYLNNYIDKENLQVQTNLETFLEKTGWGVHKSAFKQQKGVWQATCEDVNLANKVSSLGEKEKFPPHGASNRRLTATDIFIVTADGDHATTCGKSAAFGEALRWVVLPQPCKVLEQLGQSTGRFLSLFDPKNNSCCSYFIQILARQQQQKKGGAPAAAAAAQQPAPEKKNNENNKNDNNKPKPKGQNQEKKVEGAHQQPPNNKNNDNKNNDNNNNNKPKPKVGGAPPAAAQQQPQANKNKNENKNKNNDNANENNNNQPKPKQQHQQQNQANNNNKAPAAQHQQQQAKAKKNDANAKKREEAPGGSSLEGNILNLIGAVAKQFLKNDDDDNEDIVHNFAHRQVNIEGQLVKTFDLIKNVDEVVEWCKKNPTRPCRWCKHQNDCRTQNCTFAHLCPFLVVENDRILRKYLSKTKGLMEGTKPNPNNSDRSWCKFGATCNKKEACEGIHPYPGVTKENAIESSKRELQMVMNGNNNNNDDVAAAAQNPFNRQQPQQHQAPVPPATAAANINSSASTSMSSLLFRLRQEADSIAREANAAAPSSVQEARAMFGKFEHMMGKTQEYLLSITAVEVNDGNKREYALGVSAIEEAYRASKAATQRCLQFSQQTV